MFVKFKPVKHILTCLLMFVDVKATVLVVIIFKTKLNFLCLSNKSPNNTLKLISDHTITLLFVFIIFAFTVFRTNDFFSILCGIL